MPLPDIVNGLLCNLFVLASLRASFRIAHETVTSKGHKKFNAFRHPVVMFHKCIFMSRYDVLFVLRKKNALFELLQITSGLPSTQYKVSYSRDRA